MRSDFVFDVNLRRYTTDGVKHILSSAAGTRWCKLKRIKTNSESAWFLLVKLTHDI
jgi:hypothetical protein